MISIDNTSRILQHYTCISSPSTIHDAIVALPYIPNTQMLPIPFC